jgi:hypothetical protein
MPTYRSFCQGGEDSALTPFASRIAQDLGPLLFVASEDTLSLILETLSVVLEVNQGKWLSAELGDSLVSALLEVWSKNNKGSHLIFCIVLGLLCLSARSDCHVHLNGYLRQPLRLLHTWNL